MPTVIHYIILGFLFLLFGWCCRCEWKRAKKARLAWRLLALALILAGFVLLLFPPQRTVSAGGGAQAVLITEGADKDTLAKALQALPANTKSYSFWQYQYDNPPSIDTLHVFGYGLPVESWRSLKAPVLKWQPPALPAGIRYADWKRLLRLGDRLAVYGRYYNDLDEPVQVKLRWQGLTLDSLVVAANSDTLFQLHAGTYYAGEHMYRLEATAKNRQLAGEPVPVRVLAAEKIRILLLSDAPDFETSFLVKWLAAEGYPMAVSNRISSGQYSRSFVNREAFPMDRIGAAQLEKFDLLITDPLSFAARGAAFTQAVRKQVEQGSLGLLFQADSSLGAPSWYNKGIRLSLPVSKQGFRYRTISAYEGARLLQKDSSGARAVLLRAGQGYIVFNTRLNSLAWQLEGKTREYQQFWKQLLEAGAPELDLPAQQTTTAYPVAGELVTTITRSDSIKTGAFPGLEKKSAWLSTAGWQPGGWYLFNPGEWKTVRSMQTIERSRDFLRERKSQETEKKAATATSPNHQPLPRLWFLLLVFVPAIFLWVEKKLD
ncbi:MAG: hypothetical protein QM664_03220 [Flavihumibacter sp.]